MTQRTGESDRYRLLNRVSRFNGRVFSVVTDTVTMPDGSRAQRDCVHHLGAVGVVALDARHQVVMVGQYRHPVRRALWELPAGLLDVPGEDPLPAAARELAEEAGITAATWHVLLDLHTSPGYSDELIRIYLARDLDVAPQSDHVATAEESEMTVARFDLHRAIAKALAGEITNAAAVAGLLAAGQVAQQGFAGLRPPDAPRPTLPD